MKPLVTGPTPLTCILANKAIPSISRSDICGWLGDSLKVKIHAPPVEGRASRALCEFVAGALGLPRRAVTMEHGKLSRQKKEAAHRGP